MHDHKLAQAQHGHTAQARQERICMTIQHYSRSAGGTRYHSVIRRGWCVKVASIKRVLESIVCPFSDNKKHLHQFGRGCFSHEPSLHACQNWIFPHFARKKLFITITSSMVLLEIAIFGAFTSMYMLSKLIFAVILRSQMGCKIFTTKTEARRGSMPCTINTRSGEARTANA